MDKRLHNLRRNSGRYIPLDKLWEKSCGICWLCHDYVDWDFDEPTRDHVIPFSQGGVSDWSNIRLAHKQCNQFRDNPTGFAVVRDMFLSWPEMLDRKPI